jgi:hypothetical protein
MAIEKQLYERQMQLIFRMLLENKINEQIVSELKITIRSVQNYKLRLEQRYMAYQRKKTDSIIFLEINLLKNRLLKLYKTLENKVVDAETNCSDIAKCADVAAGIATSVIKLESEGIRAVKELGSLAGVAAKKNNANLNNNLRKYDDISDNSHRHYQHQHQEEEDDNRKF